MNDLLLPPEPSLPFQMRPYFGASCLSIRSLLLLDCIVMITEGLPVPYGLRIALIEGIECVVGAKTRCNWELA